MPTKHYLLAIALQLIALSLIAGCIDTSDNPGERTVKGRMPGSGQYTAYKQLIAMYPESNQGLGKEKIFPTTEHQPMTYGLVLTSESLHFRVARGEESKRRIQKAVRWLLDNQDLDRDGKPGWGLPQAWDAFSDGAINPVNQPYTITSAIVMNGLLESLTLKKIWTDSERAEIRTAMAKVAVRWCSEIWSEGYSGSYFWYSPSPVDDIFAVNSPSLFTGNLTRLLHEYPDAFTRQERLLVQSRVDGMARAIVATVELRQGLPFWDYRPGYETKRANDVLHHIYTILGIEMYRDYGGRIKLPWTREQAIASVDKFRKDAQIMEFPQDIVYTGEQVRFNTALSSLWGAGSVVAAYAYWGEFEKAKQVLETIQRNYGAWPHLQLFPGRKSDVFFPRDSAHVLWGQAVYVFCQ